MNDLLENVERAATAKFDNPGTPEKIQAAASVAKTIAEAGKAKVDAQNQLRQLHLERLKSWSVLLVPIVSLLTLLGTVIVQAIQLRQQSESSRSQSEDLEWRELLSSLRGPGKDYAADITVSSRLQTFLKSDRYKEQARRLAVRVMGNLTNVGAFAELLDATVQTHSEDELKMLLGVSRVLTGTRLSIEYDCYAEAASVGATPDAPYGVCTLALAPEAVTELARKAPNPKVSLDRRQSTEAVYQQSVSLGARISSILRAHYSVGTPRSDNKTVELTNVTLHQADLSGVDFSLFDLSNSIISFSKLDGAVLNARIMAELYDSEWWNARSIDQDLLKALIQYRFPYYSPGIFMYPSGPVTREFYEARVRALCTSRMAECNAPLPYAEPPTPKVQVPGAAAPSPPASGLAPLPGR